MNKTKIHTCSRHAARLGTISRIGRYSSAECEKFLAGSFEPTINELVVNKLGMAVTAGWLGGLDQIAGISTN